jgi:integrase
MPQHRKPARLWFKKSRGLWIIIEGTTQRGTGCGREQLREAEAALETWLAESHRPDTMQRDLSQIGCADVINLYNTEIAPALPSAATIGYQGDALLKFWSDRTLSEVKGSTCRAYAKFRTQTMLPTREGQPQRFVKASTARQELKLLGRAINHWHRESPLAAVPRVTLPAVTSKRERVLERGEVARLLRASRKLKFNHVARFILIGIYTGTRHDAILHLRWTASLGHGHVDLDRGVIYRRGSAEAETSKRRPPVKLNAKLHSLLTQMHARARPLSTAYIVEHKGQPIARMKRAWASVVKEAGLGSEVTPHVLRHTCASWLLWQGKTIWDVAGIIGADASTVERVYGHHKRIDQDERKRA